MSETFEGPLSLRALGSRRRQAAIAAVAILLLGIAGAWVRVRAASPPGKPIFICTDMTAAAPRGCTGTTTTMPYQQADAVWELDIPVGSEVATAGAQITVSFLYNGKPGTGLHAVSFESVNLQPVLATVLQPPNPALNLIGNSQGYCRAGSPTPVTSAQADPISQSILIQLAQAFPMPATMALCFRRPPGVTGGFGGVGFPTTPGGGYSIGYTESSGSMVTADYSVAAQDTTQTSQVLTIKDTSGNVVTNAGMGTPPLTFGTYALSVQGHPNSGSPTYTLEYSVFDLPSLAEADSAVFTLSYKQEDVPSTAASACSSTGNQWCLDGSGVAHGQLIIAGRGNLVEFFLSGHPGDEQTTSTDAVVSIAAGPPGVHVRPSAAPTPSPLKLPLPIAQCNPQQRIGQGNIGIGTVESYEAIQQVFYPTYKEECPIYAGNFQFTGSSEALAIPLALSLDRSETAPAFAGLNRALTSDEWQHYNGIGNVVGSNGGISVASGKILQFPVDIEPLLVTYNLPTLCTGGQEVPLSATTLSAIYLGKITSWSDRTISSLQPLNYNTNLLNCPLPILVAHDIGPSSEVFKDYLSKRVGAWKAYQRPQAPNQPDFSNAWPTTAPVACTADGSRAMAECVLGRQGTIGYGRYREIHAAGLEVAQVDNDSGQFTGLDPNTQQLRDYSQGTDPLVGCEVVASSDPAVPTGPADTGQDWSQASLTGWDQGYPICSFDFFTTSQTPCGFKNSTSLEAWLVSSLSDYAQNRLFDAGYAPIPDIVAGTSVQQAQGTTGTTLRVDVRNGIGLVMC